LILDDPVDLPEGSEVDLVPADEGDDLDDEDRARLHAALERSAEQFPGHPRRRDPAPPPPRRRVKRYRVAFSPEHRGAET